MNKNCKRVSNKNTRRVSSKVKTDDCPDGVCPIDKKKKKKSSSKSLPKVSEEPKSLWCQFLDFVFPSRLNGK